MRATLPHWCLAVVLAASAMVVSVSQAAPIVQAGLITFDNIAPTANQVLNNPTRTDRPGSLTSLQIVTAGVTVNITRENGARFDLVNNFLLTQTGKPDSWGTDVDGDGDVEAGTADRSVSLDPFYNTANYGFIFNFSDPIQYFSLLAGDFGKDFDRLTLQAWQGPDMTGNLIPGSPVVDYLPAVNGSTWTQSRFEIAHLGGFRSVLFRGGLDDFDVFVDRVFISLGMEVPPDDELDDPQIGGDEGDIVVPEPATMALLAAGGLWALRRRRA
jgi:hypothetical protein